MLSLPLRRFSSLNMRLSVYPSQYSPPRANWFPSGANDDGLNAHRMEEVGMQVNAIQSPSILRL